MNIRFFPDESQFLRLAGSANVIPVCLEVLADTETPVSLGRRFYRNRGPFFLFESVEGGERWGRYSLLSASAGRQVRLYADRLEIEADGSCRQVFHRGDPLAALRDLLRSYRPASLPGLPRFWGGLAGYLAYEAVSFFEKIPHRWPAERPLAHFMVPGEMFIFDNIRHSLFIVALACLEEGADPRSLFRSARDRVFGLADSLRQPAPADNADTPAAGGQLVASLPEDAFRAKVRRVKEHILAGDVIQTVVSQPFVSSPPPDPWELYRAQRYLNPSPYLFFLHLDGTVLVGSSPESMVRLENGQATLRPIAGTRPRGSTEAEDRRLADELLQDEKERAEHLMLVDLGRNDLGRVSVTGSVQVTDLMMVERYSHVMHLVSTIRADLRPELDAWDLIRATFPAGTLTGAPKVRAMQIIAELEEEPRGPYGGSVGYVSFAGNMDMAITIRTACIEGGRLMVRAGAGIVHDSDPERERQETVNKAMAIRQALRMVQSGAAAEFPPAGAEHAPDTDLAGGSGREVRATEVKSCC